MAISIFQKKSDFNPIFQARFLPLSIVIRISQRRKCIFLVVFGHGCVNKGLGIGCGIKAQRRSVEQEPRMRAQRVAFLRSSSLLLMLAAVDGEDNRS